MRRVVRSEGRPQTLKCQSKKYRLYSIGSGEALKVYEKKNDMHFQ